MSSAPLVPLETLFEAVRGAQIPLPHALSQLYGPFVLPVQEGRPHVMANFVSTLDGVVSLGIPGKSGGGEISGYNRHDRAVMGILRAVSDAVVVGAGTLRSVPNHLWTADYISPDLAEGHGALRASLGKPPQPLNVIVTARGDVDPGMRVFQGEVPVLVITTAAGAQRIKEVGTGSGVPVAVVPGQGPITAQAVLQEVTRVQPCETILVEGGPHLMGDFFAEGRLDEQFLTLSPQVAGRDEQSKRPGLVEGVLLAPEHPVWGTLTSIKRADSHLFLRYSFAQAKEV